MQNSQERLNLLNAKINTLTLSLNVMLLENRTSSLHELGEALCNQNLNNLENGGIWLWNYSTNEVFYSEQFCNSLKYNYGELGNGFKGFDSGNKEQMKVGYKMIWDLMEAKSIEPFINPVTYQTKDNNYLDVQCIGCIFYKNDEPSLILGTHKIL